MQHLREGRHKSECIIRAAEGQLINVNTYWRSSMSYAIVGFGKIGQALAQAFARKNINVTVASRRPPEASARKLGQLDPRSSPSRYGTHFRPTQSSWRSRSGNIRRLRRLCRAGKEKTVIDATNAFGVPPEQLGGLLSSAFVAKAFTSAELAERF